MYYSELYSRKSLKLICSFIDQNHDDVAAVVVVLPVAEANTGVAVDARIIASVRIVAVAR